MAKQGRVELLEEGESSLEIMSRNPSDNQKHEQTVHMSLAYESPSMKFIHKTNTVGIRPVLAVSTSSLCFNHRFEDKD